MYARRSTALAAVTSRSNASKSWNFGCGSGVGRSRIRQGRWGITSHSTATRSSVFNTVSTLLTVFGVPPETGAHRRT
jgi:hypothetical protein